MLLSLEKVYAHFLRLITTSSCSTECVATAIHM
jgi:hypothetical protein